MLNEPGPVVLRNWKSRGDNRSTMASELERSREINQDTHHDGLNDKQVLVKNARFSLVLKSVRQLHRFNENCVTERCLIQQVLPLSMQRQNCTRRSEVGRHIPALPTRLSSVKNGFSWIPDQSKKILSMTQYSKIARS